ncbi:hypothetical protein AB9P05_09955 [Roseivirga sp. BDSF3-8]|uniref:hypothetical protein n=1 Tax=Roseivirga sp. BDSF3-8 TaxID=3241598 RepID=UPI0035326896
MSQNSPAPSESQETSRSPQDLMQEVEELGRQIRSLNENAELDSRQLMNLILAAGGTIATALIIIRYFKSKKKRKKSFNLFGKPKKDKQLSRALKQQAAIILIAIFRKEIVKLLQKLEILDEGEFL